jgi:hypothetical protein
MANNELDAQIKAEAAQIQNAPKIPVRQLQPQTTGLAGRCSWCGRFSTNLQLVDVFHGVERYKGECCGGHNR